MSESDPKTRSVLQSKLLSLGIEFPGIDESAAKTRLHNLTRKMIEQLRHNRRHGYVDDVGSRCYPSEGLVDILEGSKVRFPQKEAEIQMWWDRESKVQSGRHMLAPNAILTNLAFVGVAVEVGDWFDPEAPLPPATYLMPD